MRYSRQITRLFKLSQPSHITPFTTKTFSVQVTLYQNQHQTNKFSKASHNKIPISSTHIQLPYDTHKKGRQMEKFLLFMVFHVKKKAFEK